MSPFSEHLDALRKTLFQIVCIISFGFALSFTYSDSLIAFLSKPLEQAAPIIPIQVFEVTNPYDTPLVFKGETIPPHQTKRIETKGSSLHLFSPAEGLITSLKISFYSALLLTAPIWIIPLLAFVLPALHTHEKKLLIPFLSTLILFLALGLWTALAFTLPFTNRYFLDYNQSLGTNLWGLSNYLDYTLTLIFSHGIGFELIGALFLLVHYRLIDLDFLRSKRRHVIVLSLIIGAILTPPDVLSQLFVAVPLYLGYELILLYGFLKTAETRGKQVTAEGE